MFDELFPYYLSIGMTSDQYWLDDPALVKAYRRADEIRRSRENERLWLQGFYVYDALLRASPVLKPFVKNTEPLPYMDEPLPLTKQESEAAAARAQQRKMEENKRKMADFAARFNKRFGGGK